MFSKELLELDRNTVQLMIDEMQNDINQHKAELEETEIQLTQQQVQLTEKDTQLQHLHRMKHLYSLLLKDQRLEDLGRAMSDETFVNELLKEYELL